MKRRPVRMLAQFPITEAERRQLKHKAIDQGVTVGELIRKALGFPGATLTRGAEVATN